MKSKDEKIDSLETQVVNLKRTVHRLEERSNDLEAAGRTDECILSGEAVAGLPDGGNTNIFVRDLLRSKINYELQHPTPLAGWVAGLLPKDLINEKSS